MNTKEMIAVIQAHADGKKIEQTKKQTKIGQPLVWKPFVGKWNWEEYIFRIAPEPELKKEGRWERAEIEMDTDGAYCLVVPPFRFADSLPRIPGFGGIDYQSPFDPKVIARSMVPVMFSRLSDKPFLDGIKTCDRPGIPVAAWFWREGEK